MRIFLIGFMGCGKSTLGRKLAKKLDYHFTDLDKQAEECTGLSVAKYFERFGEDAFRRLEHKLLQETPFSERSVIATGGGLPCFYDNMDWMNEHGVTVYISLPPSALANRLFKGKDERPLIRNLNHEELVDFITIKLSEREHYYKRSNYILDGIDLTAEKIAEYLKPEPGDRPEVSIT